MKTTEQIIQTKKKCVKTAKSLSGDKKCEPEDLVILNDLLRSNYGRSSSFGLHCVGDRDLDRSLEREGAGLGERRERAMEGEALDIGSLYCGRPTRSWVRDDCTEAD